MQGSYPEPRDLKGGDPCTGVRAVLLLPLHPSGTGAAVVSSTKARERGCPVPLGLGRS